jgi:hypothetical protein
VAPEPDGPGPDRNGAAATQADAGDASDAGRPAPTSWFLHVDLGCTEWPCNCGNVVKTMDGERRDSDCPYHGGRSPLARFVIACDGQECYSANSDFPAYPAGRDVEGMLFLSSDAPETVSIDIRLDAAHDVVGATRVEAALPGNQVNQVDLVPLWTEVPFSFALKKPIADGDHVVLEVAVDYTWSYFVGADEEHPSGFTIGGPHDAAAQ